MVVHLNALKWIKEELSQWSLATNLFPNVMEALHLFRVGLKITQLSILTEDRVTNMTETLSLLFQKSKGSPIDMNGQIVQPIYQTKIETQAQQFLARRIKTKDSPISGLRVKAVDGEIEVNGQRHAEVIFWADTSPELINFSVVSKLGCVLKLWNAWRVGDVSQAWIGNAGMIVSEEGNVTTLKCSGGSGDIDFSNLIIQLVKL